MKRYEHEMNAWCDVATSLIAYKPDRKKVYEELHQHLEDRQEELVASGLDEQAATDLALEAMGSATEIAPQLAALHKPFWGYVLRISKITLAVLLCLCCLLVRNYCKSIDWELPNTNQRYNEFDTYNADSYGGDTGRTLHHLSKPNTSASSDLNRFTVTDAAVYTAYSEYYGEDRTRLYVRIRQTSLIPSNEHEEYFSMFGTSVPFYAVDSLGNYYPFQGINESGSAWHTTRGKQTGIFSYTHELWLNDFHGEDAKWVDICYDRDGRNVSLRIYLTGGGAA